MSVEKFQAPDVPVRTMPSDLNFLKGVGFGATILSVVGVVVAAGAMAACSAQPVKMTAVANRVGKMQGVRRMFLVCQVFSIKYGEMDHRIR